MIEDSHMAPDAKAAEGAIYAIGDIHGCYGLLVDLLERIVADVDRSQPNVDAALVFLGDYIDRGPATSEVMAALVWLERYAPVSPIFLRGNHEQALLNYLADPLGNPQWLRFGGRTTLQSYGIEVPEHLPCDAEHLDLRDRIVDRLPSSHLDLLRRLAPYHETEHFVFVHAGIRFGVPLPDQELKDLLWIREGFLEEQPGWSKRVVHGHTWTESKPEVRTHRIGIDTGVFKTGVLTAAKIVGRKVEFISTHPRAD